MKIFFYIFGLVYFLDACAILFVHILTFTWTLNQISWSYTNRKHTSIFYLNFTTVPCNQIQTILSLLFDWLFWAFEIYDLQRNASRWVLFQKFSLKFFGKWLLYKITNVRNSFLYHQSTTLVLSLTKHKNAERRSDISYSIFENNGRHKKSFIIDMKRSHVPLSMYESRTEIIIVVDFRTTIKLMCMQNDHILGAYELLCSLRFFSLSFIYCYKILNERE